LATDAYPIDSGISSAATLIAAIRSATKNEPHLYFDSHAAMGNHRCTALGAVGFAVVVVVAMPSLPSVTVAGCK